VLEHVTDPGRVIRETSRVLRPGGLFFYDTINRTRASKLLMINMFQDWSLTAWMPRDLHAWERFITPGEMENLLLAGDLSPRGMTGLQPSAAPPRMLLDLIRLRRGHLTYGEFGRRSAFKRTSSTGILYAGYAVKLSTGIAQ
jgi:2-polyprenyl-6-hydroxyphenyl methylase/3-demethylubiquinone-9 3-methyltransferase